MALPETRAKCNAMSQISGKEKGAELNFLHSFNTGNYSALRRKILGIPLQTRSSRRNRESNTQQKGDSLTEMLCRLGAFRLFIDRTARTYIVSTSVYEIMRAMQRFHVCPFQENC